MRALTTLLTALALTACASTEKSARDAAATPLSDLNVERGVGDALRNTAEGVIPFRGWVRKLTGAERYSREVAAAIAAGTVRRAYLKGLGSAAGCAAPAAPR